MVAELSERWQLLLLEIGHEIERGFEVETVRPCTHDAAASPQSAVAIDAGSTSKHPCHLKYADMPSSSQGVQVVQTNATERGCYQQTARDLG